MACQIFKLNYCQYFLALAKNFLLTYFAKHFVCFNYHKITNCSVREKLNLSLFWKCVKKLFLIDTWYVVNKLMPKDGIKKQIFINRTNQKYLHIVKTIVISKFG